VCNLPLYTLWGGIRNRIAPASGNRQVSVKFGASQQSPLLNGRSLGVCPKIDVRMANVYDRLLTGKITHFIVVVNLIVHCRFLHIVAERLIKASRSVPGDARSASLFGSFAFFTAKRIGITLWHTPSDCHAWPYSQLSACWSLLHRLDCPPYQRLRNRIKPPRRTRCP